ncbi:hypothetical protein [Streptomyces kurssanovii]|uniref:SDR family NAD(P)-dependent oxidoreductase n=1 Tax=Streptomyces kurssanovii TaxID=67312 RepID=A0ABV3HQ76_9ACTN
MNVAQRVAVVTGGGGGIGGALVARLARGVARVVVADPAAIVDERSLILPHTEVLDMCRQKGLDYDRWLRGTRRYQNSLPVQA